MRTSRVLRRMEKYEVKKTLGEGSFGVAELVERKSDKTLFVIKTMTFFGSEKRKKLAEREVEVLKKARHYNVVRFHEHWFYHHTVQIVFAYYDGGDLGEAIKQQKSRESYFENIKVLEWMSQLLYGLKYLHDIRVIHRDLKPENILLTSNQRRLLIADFGLSRFVKGRGLADTTEIGTVHYMAPELFTKGRYNVEVDIWAFGCILYKVVNLSYAFPGDTKEAVLHKITTSTYKEPQRSFCQDVIRKCLKKKGTERPDVENLIDYFEDQIEQKAIYEETSETSEADHNCSDSESTSCAELVADVDDNSEASSQDGMEQNAISDGFSNDQEPRDESASTSCAEVVAVGDDNSATSTQAGVEQSAISDGFSNDQEPTDESASTSCARVVAEKTILMEISHETRSLDDIITTNRSEVDVEMNDNSATPMKTQFQDGVGQVSPSGVSVNAKASGSPESSNCQPWGRIMYYELKDRCGDAFEITANQLQIDNGTHPYASNRFCLGRIPNIRRTEQIERIRCALGRGIKLTGGYGSVSHGEYLSCSEVNGVTID